MQGDPEVLEFLNEQLTAELTAINQYFLHSKMQEHHGWLKLAKYTRAESFDEMRHAEILTHRILYLDGLPNYQRLFHVRVGQTVTEMFQADLQIEVEAIDRLRRGIDLMRGKDDITSANIFEAILADEEHHVDYLEAQLELVEKLGEPLYIAQQIEQPHDEGHSGQAGSKGHGQRGDY
ncbi:bacterioferritin [Streptomyces sp. NPDC052042]|uniref:bacterioferritin n=1 Tax=Streptomyces sp. NPDC052042 TaxID=3365683 RepID=UPI0037CF06EE